MSRIARTFGKLGDARKKALIPFFMLGYPDVETTLKLILVAAKEGASIVEIGVPFCDPVADGPMLQEAARCALEGGTTIDDLFRVAKAVRRLCDIPLVAMSYLQPVLALGVERFLDAAGAAGIDGIVIPDLRLEEASQYRRHAKARFLDTIFLVTPSMDSGKVARTCRASRGFIYCVSGTGVTGERREISKGLGRLVGLTRSCTRKPVAIGFGLSTPKQAAEAASISDGVIVGSRLARIIRECAPGNNPIVDVGRTIRSWNRALNRLGKKRIDNI